MGASGVHGHWSDETLDTNALKKMALDKGDGQLCPFHHSCVGDGGIDGRHHLQTLVLQSDDDKADGRDAAALRGQK